MEATITLDTKDLAEIGAILSVCQFYADKDARLLELITEAREKAYALHRRAHGVSLDAAVTPLAALQVAA